ncbi:MAG: AAA family ATPase [Oscillospiraceae bacterium]|nr:AAA family ATPase [Oscillospiraceae bacterium]
MDLFQKYKALEIEFGEKGAAILAGLQSDEQKAKALSGSGKYSESLERFFAGRDTAYSTYSEEQCDLLKKLEQFIISSGSAGKAVKALGVSASVLSGIRNCSYNGNTEDFFESFKTYSELKKEKKETKIYKDIEYAPTSISETIYQTLRSVHLNGECEIITGDAGIGKTRSVRKYTSDYARNTISITPTYADSSVKGVLMLLADSLGISGVSNLNALHRAVCSKLHDGMLIIVDEAQHLSFRAIDHLRTISTSFTENGETLGIAFIGNPSLKKHFTDKKLGESGQVWDRAGFRPEFHSEDVKYEDIKLLFPELAAEKKEAELKFLLAISQTNDEGIRRAVIFYKNAYNSNNGSVTIDYLASLATTANARIPNLSNVLKRIKDECSK